MRFALPRTMSIETTRTFMIFALRLPSPPHNFQVGEGRHLSSTGVFDVGFQIDFNATFPNIPGYVRLRVPSPL